jgi:hypothetical protein
MASTPVINNAGRVQKPKRKRPATTKVILDTPIIKVIRPGFWSPRAFYANRDRHLELPSYKVPVETGHIDLIMDILTRERKAESKESKE